MEEARERERGRGGTRRYLGVACYYEGGWEGGSGAGVCVEDVWLAVQRRRPGVPRRSFGISLTPPLIISLFLPASFVAESGNAPYKPARCGHLSVRFSSSWPPKIQAGEAAKRRVCAQIYATARTRTHACTRRKCVVRTVGRL